jgi:hypothetical protein
MVGFLKNKTGLGFAIVTAILVTVGLFLFFKNECNYEPSVEVKLIIADFNRFSAGNYEASIDKCYPEIHIINKSNEVDTILYHNLLVKVNRAEVGTHKVVIYNEKGIILYLAYTVLRSSDTSYHWVKDYEY